ncbi:MAG: hypothetical protein HUU35_00615 [Armatimonadetes bacterium]|nr:hypothetical protein [Armatimonadota bacterium]
MRTLGLSLGVIALLGTSPAHAIPIDVGVSGALIGNYVFRGARLLGIGLQNDAYATFGLTPRLSATAYLWQYILLDAGKGIAEGDYDASLSYTPGWFNDLVTATAGYVYYDVNNSPGSAAFLGRDTQEAYAGLDFALPWSPAIYAWYDFDNAVGTYLRASAGNSFGLGASGWNLDVLGAVGFDFGRTNGFQDGLVRTALSYELEPGLTLGPAVDWWFPSSRIDPGADGFRPVLSLVAAYNNSF